VSNIVASVSLRLHGREKETETEADQDRNKDITSLGLTLRGPTDLTEDNGEQLYTYPWPPIVWRQELGSIEQGSNYRLSPI